MSKTNKAAKKRFKVTKNGKVMHRKAGRGHFNAKDDGSATRDKRGQKEQIAEPEAKEIKKSLLPHS